MVKYIAVARNKELLCSYMNPEVKDSEIYDGYVKMANSVLSAPTWHEQVLVGTTHSLSCAPNKFHFTMDKEERVYIVIAESSCPARSCFQLLSKLRGCIEMDYGTKSLQCNAMGLQKCMKAKVNSLFKMEESKIQQVGKKIDDVTITMSENIQNVLKNTETLESVEGKTNQLNQQAKVFRATGTSLQRQLWWKNIKLNIIIAMAIIIVFILFLSAVGAF